MNLGFTGARTEPSSEQKLWLVNFLLESPPGEFHHGCCVGSDEFAHRAAKQCGIKSPIQIVLHPPSDPKLEMEYTDWDYANCVWAPKKGYLERNNDIVAESDRMIAMPNGPEKVHSGTWATIRYSIQKHKPVTIVWPDGLADSR